MVSTFERRLRKVEAQLHAGDEPTLRTLLMAAKREAHARLRPPEAPGPPPPPEAGVIAALLWRARQRASDARQHTAGHVCAPQCPMWRPRDASPHITTPPTASFSVRNASRHQR
jgi:hypothetical protein